MDTPMLDPDSDGEYEYEYGSETETFYINLDLTAHHGAVRPPRRRPGEKANIGPQNSTNRNNQDHQDDSYPPIESAETGSVPNERIQILDLHTHNPIISYYNQLFSCSWADQIGTELVFSSPDTPPETDNSAPLHRGASYELVAANSVKILGRKAQLAASAEPEFAQNVNKKTFAGRAEPLSSQNAETLAVPRRPAAPSHQALFLHKLQQIKTAKGETDAVRTVMSTRRQPNLPDLSDRMQGWARTEAQLAEIDRLNERASRGDVEAQATLELLIQELNQEPNPLDLDSESQSDSDLDSDFDSTSESDDLIS
ncbi:hypothetical protein N7457_006891 [Penicillium paradoxum]|uniref:uncharacterized protein n=1 Tax=Penicillium paradoxum TaxID=176176 RepID=UPI002547E69C|nr:uncharacterized protein N7457_006891 [Penicillium paradoxum]KAJ5779171.1 hypothetical protein N7457_006891 [Penicillium paradoxum]